MQHTGVNNNDCWPVSSSRFTRMLYGMCTGLCISYKQKGILFRDTYYENQTMEGISPRRYYNPNPIETYRSLAEIFPESEFVRLGWDKDGVLSNGQDFFSAAHHEENKGQTTLNDLEVSLGTASMVTRWRDTHPDLVGTDKDCVRETCTAIRRAMGLRTNENLKLKIWKFSGFVVIQEEMIEVDKVDTLLSSLKLPIDDGKLPITNSNHPF